MIRRGLARAAIFRLVPPFLTFASALAPAHLHEPGPGHEHEHAVAHSHFAPHQISAHHHAAEVERDDADLGYVVWLDSSILHEVPQHISPPPAATPVSYDIVRVELRWAVTQVNDAAPAHGPPKRGTLFRGPPASLA